MSCLTQKKIASYLLEELSPEDNRSVVAHIETCAICEDMMSNLVEELALGEDSTTTDNVASNLLFALLALHNSLITRQQLVSATSAWLENKQESLEQWLLRQKAISSDDQVVIQALVRKHLATNGNSAAQSLAGLSSLNEVKDDLRELNDPDVEASLSLVPTVASSYGESNFEQSNVRRLSRFTERERYTELHQHAQGGLGEVYVAIDKQLDRNVALKRIQPRLVDDQMSRMRFEQEAEVTGRLEHPGVVPVYGRGADKSGRPFYAMRFIQGRTLKDHITDFHRMHGDTSWRTGEARIELLALIDRVIDVCHTIEYAHHRGVLHRDLKPDNIMLGRFGETLVVDWGLAKRSDSTIDDGPVQFEPIQRPKSASDVTPTPTTYGTVVGTLGYMSPEQAAGDIDSMGPASDVYGLGAILYRTLTNRASQETKEKHQVVLERISRGEFPRPRERKPQIPPPLESICLKAMSLAPEDRYGSAEQLAKELGKWIADEKVAAHNESVLERAFRMARRYRGILAAAIAAIITLSAISVATMASHQADLAKQQARESLLQARMSIDGFLSDSSQGLRHLPGVEGFTKHLLDTAAIRYEALLATSSNDPEYELERARTLLRLGEAYLEVRENDVAAAKLRKAKELLEGLIKKGGTTRDAATFELANCHTRLGRLAIELAEPNDEEFRTAIELYRSLVEMDGRNTSYRQALGAVGTQRASAFLARGELDQALEWAGNAVESYQRSMRLSPNDSTNTRGVSVAHSIKGEVYRRRGNRDAARALFEGAVRQSEELLRKDPSNRDYRELLADSRSFLAQMHRGDGKIAAEVVETALALKEYEALQALHPDISRYSESASRARMDAAQIDLLVGKSKQAEEQLLLSKGEFEQLLAVRKESPSYQANLASCCDRLAKAQINLGKYQEAVAASEQAVQMFARLDAVLPNEPTHRHRLALALTRQGIAYGGLKNVPAARAAFEQAAHQLNQLVSNTPANESEIYNRDFAIALGEYGAMLWDNADVDRSEASQTLLAAKTIWTNLFAAYQDSANDIAPWTKYVYGHFLVTCPDPNLRDGAAATRVGQTLIESAPTNPEFHGLLGAARYRVGVGGDDDGVLTDSIKHIDRASDLRDEPREFDLFILAMAKAKVGDSQDAQTTWTHANKLLDSRNPGELGLLRLREEAKIAIDIRGSE